MVLIYVVSALVLGALIIGACLVSFGYGVRTTGKAELRKSLRALRLTKEDVILYRKAARLLNRLINVTDLDGDMAADIVSDQTRKQIEVWLIEYKKELDKV